jgi:hypothetical protein
MTVGGERQEIISTATGVVGRADLLVSRAFGSRGGAAALPYRDWVESTAANTRSTLMPFMQRKSIGHSRRKHGEHGAADLISWFRVSPGNPGPVNSGEVLPNGTTTGVLSAAATCIGPVSFVSRTRQIFSKAINSRRDVFPATF